MLRPHSPKRKWGTFFEQTKLDVLRPHSPNGRGFFVKEEEEEEVEQVACRHLRTVPHVQEGPMKPKQPFWG